VGQSTGAAGDLIADVERREHGLLRITQVRLVERVQ
jgi:hypothetical protein